MRSVIGFGFSPMVLFIFNGFLSAIFGFDLNVESEIINHELRLEVSKSRGEELELSEVMLRVQFKDDVLYDGVFNPQVPLKYHDDFENRKVEITTTYDNNLITFTHTPINLDPTLNEYDITVSYKNKIVTQTVDSFTTYELDHIKYFIDGQEINNEPIPVLELPEVSTLTVVTQNTSGNLSKTETKLYNPTLYVNEDEQAITIKTSESTDVIFINGEETSSLEKSKLQDTEGPNTPGVTYQTSSDRYDISFQIDKPIDKGSTYELNVEVIGSKYKKHDIVETNIISGVSGYYYAVETYPVNDINAMTFTTDATVHKSLSKGSHVISVIAVDHAGNLSAPSHTNFSLVDLEKKALVSSIYSGSSSVMTNKLLTVPTNILNFIKNNGITIKTDGNLNQYLVGYAAGYSSILAVYHVDYNQMMFRQKSESDLSNILNKHFYHELGHAIDTNTGDPAMSAEFSSIYYAGKDILFPGNGALNAYFKTNVWEYFAECVNLYYTNKSALHKHPESYQFISNHLTQHGL